MNKAVPLTPHDVELDVREAARHAARREGLSIGDWLDRIVSKRAAARGVAPADLSPDERLDAVTEQLMRLARERPQHSVSAERILANFESDRRRIRAYAGATATAPRSVRDKGIMDLLMPAIRPGSETVQALQPEGELEDALLGSSRPQKMASSPARIGAASLQSNIADEVRSWGGEPPVPPQRPGEPRDELPPAEPTIGDDGPTGAAQTPGQEPDQMSQVEAKLAALFQALDKTPAKAARRPIEPPMADPTATEPPQEDGAQAAAARSRALLQGTAMTSAPSLEQAIAQIAERQAFLESTAPADVAAPGGGGRSLAGDLLHRYGTSRLRRGAAGADRSRLASSAAMAEQPSSGQTDLSSGPAVPATLPVALAAPTAVDFSALQAEISGLAKRIEDIHRSAEHRDATLAKDASVGELRTLLDGIGQGKVLDTLEQRVETLAAKIDSAIETRLQPSAIEHLAQRIEDVRSAMAATLDRPADTTALEQKIDGLAGNIDALRQNAVDGRTLDEMMRGLAAKLDAAGQPQADAAVFGELQAQLGKLAERIDHSDAGLAAIVSVERSLGELFAQLEETREAAINAAETAARTAARDTLRAAMLDASLPGAQGQGGAQAAVANVTQQIAELKATREAADLRLHSMLTALNKTLEKVAERLEPGAVAGLSGAGERAAAGERTGHVLDLADSPGLLAAVEATARPMKPSVHAASTADRPMVPVDLDEADFPIEPGTGSARAPQLKPAERSNFSGEEAKTDPADFIAAARRAAQAAAQDSMNRTSAAAAERSRGIVPEMAGGTFAERATGFVAQRRRPLLLTLAGLILLLGAAQMARLTLSRPAAVTVGDASTEAAPAAPEAAAQTAGATAPATSDAVPTIAKSADIAAQPADAVAAPAKPTEAAAAPATAAAAEPTPEAAATPSEAVKPLPTLAMGFGAKRPADQPNGLPARLRDLAQHGDAAAQYEVGLRMADGRGVPRDLKGAADWFEKAAKQGIAPAAYRLGSLYEKGLGVARDPALSTQWYQKAADQGNVRAMHNLAVMSAEGAGGKSDYARAASWFTKAAQAGVRDSQFNLAILYARGLGIEQNLGQSYTWFAIAAAQGDSDAAKKRDEVAARLDAPTLASAKAAAEQFHPTPTDTAANEVKAPAGGWDAVVATPGAASSAKPTAGAHVSSM